jgi:hypothetical protein
MTLAFIRSIRKVQIHGQKLLPQFPWSPYEDYRITLVGDHATSSIALTYATKQWAAQVELWGDNGIVRADLESQAVVHYQRDQLKAATVGASAAREAFDVVRTAAGAGLSLATKQLDSTHDVLVHRFAASVRDNAPPPVSPEEGRESIRVLDMLVAELDQPSSRTTATAS